SRWESALLQRGHRLAVLHHPRHAAQAIVEGTCDLPQRVSRGNDAPGVVVTGQITNVVFSIWVGKIAEVVVVRIRAAVPVGCGGHRTPGAIVEGQIGLAQRVSRRDDAAGGIVFVTSADILVTRTLARVAIVLP